MQEYTSEDARRQWRRILNEVERDEPVGVTRYGKLLAVVVGAGWYRRMTAAEGALETIQPLDGIVRLTVSTDSDVAFGLLEEAYRRAVSGEGGKDSGRERLVAMKGIMADALKEYLDRRETAPAEDAKENER